VRCLVPQAAGRRWWSGGRHDPRRHLISPWKRGHRARRLRWKLGWVGLGRVRTPGRLVQRRRLQLSLFIYSAPAPPEIQSRRPPTPPRCGGSVRARAASRVAGRLGIGTGRCGATAASASPSPLYTGPGRRLRSGSQKVGALSPIHWPWPAD
jgi:hypothetical protein